MNLPKSTEPMIFSYAYHRVIEHEKIRRLTAGLPKQMQEVKKLDMKGAFFTKTKNEIIEDHKKKYSLMELIKNV